MVLNEEMLDALNSRLKDENFFSNLLDWLEPQLHPDKTKSEQHMHDALPDVAPSDYHMFPALKKHLGGKKFESDAEVQKEVNTWLREADGEWYSAGIDKFIVRMRKVLEKMAIM
uniref:Uncharacterized protein n=1 Tax=Anopheles minimus TaxID=112268 RepID=A0A182WG77_9DIPT